jgi:hypothetical protein
MSPRMVATLISASAVVVAIGMAALAAAPAARAANPAPLPPPLTAAIVHDNLAVQTVHGLEAVTGDAADIDAVKSLATSLGIGTNALYTASGEAGQAILIFTGNDDPGPMAFQVTGATITSASNGTSQPWFVYDASGKPDAAIPAGTAANITPTDGAIANFTVGNLPMSIAGATFSL